MNKCINPEKKNIWVTLLNRQANKGLPLQIENLKAIDSQVLAITKEAPLGKWRIKIWLGNEKFMAHKLYVV